MVMRLKKHIIIIILLILSLLINIQDNSAFTPFDTSQVQYRIDREWATIWINDDASIELHYNITITYESQAQGYITIGLPKKFDIISVENLQGNSLSYDDVSSGSNYAVEVYLGHPMSSGDSGTVLLIAIVQNMFFPDDMNPGNLGMQFKPTYYDAWITDLRLAIVPPEGVTENNVKTQSPEGMTAFFTTVNGDFALYWERRNLPPELQPLTFGISIPEEFINLPQQGLDITFTLIVLGIIGFFILLVIIIIRRRRTAYVKPRIRIEALGPARGLTAVEAAMVVGLEPVRVLTMILFGLLTKRMLIVKETEPIIKVERIDEESENRYPRYYEIDFFKSLESDGSLNERGLARTYISLRDNVDKKMRGYARIDTVNYYKSIVDQAWNQVKRADTPQLAGEMIDKNLEWLLLDEKYDEKFRTILPPNFVIVPNPTWYWYGPNLPTKSTPSTPSLTPEIRPTPAQEFADKIVTGVERAAGGLVKNIEEFTSRIVPQKVTAQSSSSVRRRANCVCACASCACACACVSCACACAGGGAR